MASVHLCSYPPRMLRRIAPVLAFTLASVSSLTSLAQSTEHRLDDAAGWKPGQAPAPGTDEAIILEARTAVATGEPKKAINLLNAWIEEYQTSDNVYLPEAYLVRGDALVAIEDEYEALYDYEMIVKEFAATPEFVSAMEREFEIAKRYVNGLDKKWWFGWRIEDASLLGEEMLVRINERMPGSKLAEAAMLELADFYYRERDLALAAESYDIFLINYPNSPDRSKAMQRRVFANIAKFKGPKYDASGLIEAKDLVDQYSGKYPLEAEQAGLSDALMARLDESSAASMLDTANWYLVKKDDPSARLTLRRLVQKHPGTISAGRAIDLMDARGWLPKPAEVKPAEEAAVPSVPVEEKPANQKEPG